jgi:hypothetical protein
MGDLWRHRRWRARCLAGDNQLVRENAVMQRRTMNPGVGSSGTLVRFVSLFRNLSNLEQSPSIHRRSLLADVKELPATVVLFLWWRSSIFV